MTSAVSICSNALLQLGKSPLSSLEDVSDAATICANIYPEERRALLRDHPWNSATKRVILAPLVDVPAFGFGAQFLLPSDFLRLVSVGDWWRWYGGPTPGCNGFRLEGRNILASGTQLPIEYVFDNDVEATWDAHLVDLMTVRMTWKLAYPITQSTSLAQSKEDSYERLARKARSIDSQENPSEMLGSDFPIFAARF